MFKSVTDFLEQYLVSGSEEPSRKEHNLELCAAALMMEIALADSGVDADERQVIESSIKHHFHLNDEEVGGLLDVAKREVDHSTSLHEFTRVVNDTLSREEKVTIIELLWKVASADMVIDKYEEYYIRKIADLLYVSHSDYIKAKHKATE